VDLGPTFHFDAYLDADPVGHPDVDQNTVQAFDFYADPDVNLDSFPK
jgi:hypothetical protein